MTREEHEQWRAVQEAAADAMIAAGEARRQGDHDLAEALEAKALKLQAAANRLQGIDGPQGEGQG